MKAIISSLCVAITCLTNTSLWAEPITHPVDYICPKPSSLGNFGNYISGFGLEILSSRTTNEIYFQSRDPLFNVPNSFINYNNSGTYYDGATGYVSCNFKSTNPLENNFDISYKITNGKGGQIQSRTNSSIRVLFFVGLDK